MSYVSQVWEPADTLKGSRHCCGAVRRPVQRHSGAVIAVQGQNEAHESRGAEGNESTKLKLRNTEVYKQCRLGRIDTHVFAQVWQFTCSDAADSNSWHMKAELQQLGSAEPLQQGSPSPGEVPALKRSVESAVFVCRSDARPLQGCCQCRPH